MRIQSKLITLMIAVMLIASLVGCATPTPEPTATAIPATAVPPTAVPTPVPPTATAAPQPITIRYANWNLGAEADNNIQRQMVKAYKSDRSHVVL